MGKKIGFIQTVGIGDILMILPIADHFEAQGWEIVWPIDHRYVAMFSRAKPSIKFLPVEGSVLEQREFFLDRPLKLLADHGCEKTVMFYMPMFGLMIGDPRLAASLKSDEYKYAIAGVPFRKKWELTYERDLVREERLFERLNINGPYVCVHEDGSDVQLPFPIPPEAGRDFQVVRVEPISDSIFDWRLTLERAHHLYLIESCFSNLVEQLSLPVPKSIMLRVPVDLCPVLKSDWNFISANPADLLAYSGPRTV
jgi:hypothetical protein